MPSPRFVVRCSWHSPRLALAVAAPVSRAEKADKTKPSASPADHPPKSILRARRHAERQRRHHAGPLTIRRTASTSSRTPTTRCPPPRSATRSRSAIRGRQRRVFRGLRRKRPSTTARRTCSSFSIGAFCAKHQRVRSNLPLVQQQHKPVRAKAVRTRPASRTGPGAKVRGGSSRAPIRRSARTRRRKGRQGQSPMRGQGCRREGQGRRRQGQALRRSLSTPDKAPSRSSPRKSHRSAGMPNSPLRIFANR